MSMLDYEYYRPSTMEEALQLLQDYREGARVLAGGTDLVIALRKGEVAPRALVDIQLLPELQSVEVQGENLVVGAGVSFARLSTHPLVLRWAPALAEAASQVGSPQIRNRGTIGGNLGTASPAGDTLTPLVALEAQVRLRSLEGERLAPVESFLARGGGQSLQPGELIQEVRLPLVRESLVKSAFVKLGRRNALAISRINLALILGYDGDTPVRARLALGAVGPSPFRVPAAEAVLTGRHGPDLARMVMREAAQAVAASLGSRPTAPYKTRAVQGMVLEALRRLGLAA